MGIKDKLQLPGIFILVGLFLIIGALPLMNVLTAGFEVIFGIGAFSVLVGMAVGLYRVAKPLANEAVLRRFIELITGKKGG